MNGPIPPQTTPCVVDPVTGLVRTDLECRRCGYNLRTLAEAGRCPECGSPVGLSTRGNFLQFADPQWVAKVAKGLQIIFAMIIVNFLVGLAAGCIGTLTPTLPVILSWVATCVELYGVWLLTEPDPSGIGEEKNITARKVVRVSSIIAACGGAIQLADVTFTSAFGEGTAVLTLFFGGISGLASLVAFFVRYSYFAIIAKRIPDDHLVRRAYMLRKAIVICAVIGIVAGIFASALTAGSSAAANVGMAIAIILPAVIAFLVFMIWTVVYIYAMQKSVTEESRLADANWARALRPPAIAVPVQSPADREIDMR
ncbi:MAG: hypothetical protein H6818_00365 [Phycisphaerales bacterium]|nr:hypothetical protein [Phycisphaerales bacterium]